MSIWCDILRRNEQIWQIRLEIRKTAICLQYLLAVGRVDEKNKGKPKLDSITRNSLVSGCGVVRSLRGHLTNLA